LAWMQSDSGSRVNQVCLEAADGEECPTAATLKSIWRRLYPPMNEQRENCGRCGGSGFIIVDGEHGTSGAYPCSHRAESEADRRMGIRFSPVTARLYAKDMREAEERKIAWAKNSNNPINKSFVDKKKLVERIIAPLAGDIYRGEF
jgi:hypothetical protein